MNFENSLKKISRQPTTPELLKELGKGIDALDATAHRSGQQSFGPPSPFFPPGADTSKGEVPTSPAAPPAKLPKPTASTTPGSERKES